MLWDGGQFERDLTVIVPPVILTQPQSQMVMQGSNATFSVVAEARRP